MRIRIQEASRVAVNMYLIMLLLVLPLYMQDGYTMIGDVKYRFFLNVTLFFLMVMLVLFVIWLMVKGEKKRIKVSFSGTDIAAVCFLGSAVASWCFSQNKTVAWYGFPGWYMGLLSQLIFVWIYFAASRLYDGSWEVLWAFLLGAVTVMALGVLNCYNVDPLYLFQNLGDWNREHLLSTIGNKNWYCGYVSVASSACICFACTGNKVQRTAGLVGCLLFFWTLLTQGSEGGYLILFAQMVVLLIWSLDNRKKLLSFLSVVMCCPLAGLLGQYCIRFRGLVLVEDGTLSSFLFWKGWLPMLAFLVVFLILLYMRSRNGCEDKLQSKAVRKIVIGVIAAAVVSGTFLLILCQISDKIWELSGGKELLRLTNTWGNNRGAIWRMGMESFFNGGVISKLFGVGPDCFYYAVREYDSVSTGMYITGQWEGAVCANAHNEWLNMLLNQGILGLLAYGGIFVASYVRLWKWAEKNPTVLLGLMAISGYCMYGIVSFQQAVSTPLLFAVLGIAEAIIRRTKRLYLRL